MPFLGVGPSRDALLGVDPSRDARVPPSKFSISNYDLKKIVYFSETY